MFKSISSTLGDYKLRRSPQAQYEMKLVLATILSRTELALAETEPVKPKRRGLLLATESGVRMVAIGRRQKAVLGAVAVS
ncbi:cytochrome P450 [Laspinema sp. A4]|uniref:cytochrome P450 n=1 Tax=Laspinema sp. D2d TaxID=2953686 RepID=UPI0021BB1BDD|nr:cytochrome P450 [Laspinema sp. D2d]MCT7983496.1 cytochrome P450 [Laspinema sp. D2d]